MYTMNGRSEALSKNFFGFRIESLKKKLAELGGILIYIFLYKDKGGEAKHVCNKVTRVKAECDIALLALSTKLARK